MLNANRSTFSDWTGSEAGEGRGSEAGSGIGLSPYEPLCSYALANTQHDKINQRLFYNLHISVTFSKYGSACHLCTVFINNPTANLQLSSEKFIRLDNFSENDVCTSLRDK